MRKGGHLALAASLLLASAGLTGRALAAQGGLAGVRAVNCTFSVYATGTWTNGRSQAEVLPARFAVQFDAINVDEGTARVIGDYGPSDIIVRLSTGTLHLLQAFSAGPVYMTTIFPKETVSGRLQAVHTRHELTAVSLPGFTSKPEQYYGECEPRK